MGKLALRDGSGKPDPNQNGLYAIRKDLPDSLTWWADQYIAYRVTTAPSSRRIQVYDIKGFLNFMASRVGDDRMGKWIPRLSREYVEYLRSTRDENTGEKRWGDRSINRIIYHLKPFSTWIHSLKPFPLGNPMSEISGKNIGPGLEVERALTPRQRLKILETADELIPYPGKWKKPYRDRAIIYVLISTGMRRSGVCNMDLDGIDYMGKSIKTVEKGGLQHAYLSNRKAMKVLREYIGLERPGDDKKWKSDAVFLADGKNGKGKGRLNPQAIYQIWRKVCQVAGVKGKSPHSCRHAMGKMIIQETGNPAAVQRQLGHRSSIYSMQYMGVSDREMRKVLEKVAK